MKLRDINTHSWFGTVPRLVVATESILPAGVRSRAAHRSL